VQLCATLPESLTHIGGQFIARRNRLIHFGGEDSSMADAYIFDYNLNTSPTVASVCDLGPAGSRTVYAPDLDIILTFGLK
jgi:hypothetical protein